MIRENYVRISCLRKLVCLASAFKKIEKVIKLEYSGKSGEETLYSGSGSPAWTAKQRGAETFIYEKLALKKALPYSNSIVNLSYVWYSTLKNCGCGQTANSKFAIKFNSDH
jgi:hypothetical protein